VSSLRSRITTALACAVLALAVGGAAHPAKPSPPKRGTLTVVEVERWLTGPGTSGRDRMLSEWARGAALDDLLWVLRHPSATLGGSEAAMVEAALRKTPAERAEVRQRLLARRAIVLPPRTRRNEPPLPSLEALRPWASVHRVTAILPDRGEYAGFARAVRTALAEGLRSGRPAGARPIELDTLATGDGDPARVAAAFEQARKHSDVIVGELLSSPTLALATAANVTGQVLVSPTATDERIGKVGPRIVQVGPGPEARARALADVVLGREPRVVAISGSTAGVRSAFADAFATQVTGRGGRVARREALRTSSAELAAHVRAVRESGATVLFWDGPARDAESLLQTLATQGVNVRLCGGPALAPEGMRAGARALLEGVAWVSDDWRLPPPVRARLDSMATASGLRPGAFWTQGWLAGRGIASAIDGGARSAEEVARALRVRDDGLLEARPLGATLPVFVVSGGRAVEARAVP
jgi:ABC-type branched-subunit amino acid transport system substrate-binding protein